MLKRLGNHVLQKFENIPYALGFIGHVFKYSALFVTRGKAARKILIMQLLFTYIEALPLIALLALALGSALYLVGNPLLLSIGQSTLIYKLLVVIIAQELGPILVAFIVTARSATAIATELGSMVVTHQIESYVSVGVDPLNHLVTPRFMGVTASVFLLTVYFSLCGLIGPYFLTLIFDPVSAGGYFAELFKELTVSVILTSALKSILFGMVISLVACYFGLNVERASTEVPIAAISAVGNSFFGIILVDVFIVVLQYIF
ncbi:MAG: ABC transporter permease [Treponema sp.]|nr:ABC transporter permease [Treponema sp.]